MSTSLAKLILPGLFWIEDVPPTASTVVADNIIGTAFVLDASQGWLVTAQHVVQGLNPSTCRARSMFSRGPSPLYGLGLHMTISQIVMHPHADVALLRMDRRATAGRAIPFVQRPLDIAESVMLFGHPGGTEYVYCDDLLGPASPKSPTPVVVSGIVSALVPHDGRPVELYVSDVTTHGGNSGGPLVSCDQRGVGGIHVAGAGGYGYALPIDTGVDLLSTVSVATPD
jgi:S1-C subfamily serine protease